MEMFKNIFVMGVGRSGKTTLSKMISKKYGYSIISIDGIVTAMRAFPDLNIWKPSANGNRNDCHPSGRFRLEYMDSSANKELFVYRSIRNVSRKQV